MFAGLWYLGKRRQDESRSAGIERYIHWNGQGIIRLHICSSFLMQMSSETNFCKVLGLTVDITNSFLNNTFIGRTVPEG